MVVFGGFPYLREKKRGITPLNTYNQMEQWQSTLYPFFELNWTIENLCVTFMFLREFDMYMLMLFVSDTLYLMNKW